MWVHLIDADSTIANLVIMKLSAYFKKQGAFITMSRGDTLGFPTRSPDKIFISVVYKKNSHMFDDLQARYPSTQIDIGGSGYDLKKVLPPDIEKIKPDYSLYSEIDYSLGHSSRGCIRNCYFCVLPAKEGLFRRTQHPSEWYDPKFTKIKFLDSNILCDPDWFFEVTDWCLEKGLEIDFQSGYDVRLVNFDIARRLHKILKHNRQFKKQKKQKQIMLNFSWDNVKDEEIIRDKIALLQSAGFTRNDFRNCVQFYVYIDSDEQFDGGLYRCLELRKLNINSFVMFNIDNKQSDRIHRLQRWADRKQIYWANSPVAQELLEELKRMADGEFTRLLDNRAEVVKIQHEKSVRLMNNYTETTKELLENSHVLIGDCAEKLKSIPDDSVDLIVSDPPYGYSL